MRVSGSMFPTYSEKAHRKIVQKSFKNAPASRPIAYFLQVLRLSLHFQTCSWYHYQNKILYTRIVKMFYGFSWLLLIMRCFSWFNVSQARYKHAFNSIMVNLLSNFAVRVPVCSCWFNSIGAVMLLMFLIRSLNTVT